MYIYLIINFIFFEEASDMSFIFTESDYLLIAAAAVRFCGTRQIDRFKDISDASSKK